MCCLLREKKKKALTSSKANWLFDFLSAFFLRSISNLHSRDALNKGDA